MLSSERFFQAFDRAGFLKTALWTPSAGGAQRSAQVRLRAPGSEVLSGEVLSTDYSIQYPATELGGLKRGESLTVDAVSFKVREGPKSLHDGSVLEVKLALVP